MGRELSRTTTAAGPVTRAALTRTYNRAGQVLSEDSQISGDPTNGITTYAYDPLARLTAFTRAATTTTYGWDEVPNRTSVQTGAGSPLTTTFDAGNRPTSDSAGGTYSSDADGRLTSQPGQRLGWDTLGRLTEVLPASGSTPLATYTYDPLDRLRLVDDGSSRVRFRYVGLTSAVAQTIDDVTGSVIRHVGTGWTGERLVDWTGTGQNERVYGENAHHDVVWTASSSGAVSATLRYDPWGTLTASSGASLPDFRFQGSWFDTTTDLGWVITRWYAPSLGRFVSEDSLLGDPVDPPSRHLYAYAMGEPIGRWDPDGYSWCSVVSPCTHSALYHGEASQIFRKTLRNTTHARGKFLVHLYIATKWSSAFQYKLKGDWRGDSRTRCVESRACIYIDLDNSNLWVAIRPTCESLTGFGDWARTLPWGDELPPELRRRETRLARIRAAKAALEAEARERTGDPQAIPEAKAQRNFTDPESQIMHSKPDGWIYGYNTQIAVDDGHQVIVATSLSADTTDTAALPALVDQIETNTGRRPRKLLADAGYASDDNLAHLAERGIDAYVATRRDRHSAKAPVAPRGRIPAGLTRRERMARKLTTQRGRAEYRRRKAIVEPVFGQTKEARGFRRFRLRGRVKVTAEWHLVCAVHNLGKLFRAGRLGRTTGSPGAVGLVPQPARA